MDNFDPSQTSFEVNALDGIRKLGRSLQDSGTGKAVKQLTISFATAENKEHSTRGRVIAELLRMTPNIVTLNLKFSGYLDNQWNCLGEVLEATLCSLKRLEHFSHNRMTSARTAFGQATLMKLVSSWPNLRTLYLSGDTNNVGGCAEIPPATCAIEAVTFERLMAGGEKMATMFAGSADSLTKFEAWTMCSEEREELSALLRPVLPAIKSLTLGYCHPRKDFIINELSNAPHLQYVTLKSGFESQNSSTRHAFVEALNREGSFPSLKSIRYGGQSGTYKTGRGRNVREHAYSNPGEKELQSLAESRGIYATLDPGDLEYKVEGAQRRMGFAMASRRWAPY